MVCWKPGAPLEIRSGRLETEAGMPSVLPPRACIEKSPRDWTVAPNLLDYAATCGTFSWAAAREALEGLPGGGGRGGSGRGCDAVGRSPCNGRPSRRPVSVGARAPPAGAAIVMTADALKTVVLEALKRIAPEMDSASFGPDAPIRDELDLHSMDFLNFVLALHERLGVEIPETDYSRLTTLAGVLAYLNEKAATAERVNSTGSSAPPLPDR